MCEERREECDNRTVAITAIFDYFKNNVLMPRNGDEISLCSSCRRSIRDIIYLTRRGVLFMDRIIVGEMCCSNSLRIFCNAIFPNLHRVSYFRSMEVHFLSEVSSDFTDLYPLFSGESEAVTIDFITNNNFGVNRCNLRC